jgi:hypothetical protein
MPNNETTVAHINAILALTSTIQIGIISHGLEPDWMHVSYRARSDAQLVS